MESDTMAKADIFSVWGSPPQALLKGLSSRQITVLKRYTEATASGAYRLGFDCGVDEAFNIVSETVTDKWQKRRAKSRRPS
jgi:hypothetical protein